MTRVIICKKYKSDHITHLLKASPTHLLPAFDRRLWNAPATSVPVRGRKHLGGEGCCQGTATHLQLVSPDSLTVLLADPRPFPHCALAADQFSPASLGPFFQLLQSLILLPLKNVLKNPSLSLFLHPVNSFLPSKAQFQSPFLRKSPTIPHTRPGPPVHGLQDPFFFTTLSPTKTRERMC